jgi:hypothetical protein
MTPALTPILYLSFRQGYISHDSFGACHVHTLSLSEGVWTPVLALCHTTDIAKCSVKIIGVTRVCDIPADKQSRTQYQLPFPTEHTAISSCHCFLVPDWSGELPDAPVKMKSVYRSMEEFFHKTLKNLSVKGYLRARQAAAAKAHTNSLIFVWEHEIDTEDTVLVDPLTEQPKVSILLASILESLLYFRTECSDSS